MMGAGVHDQDLRSLVSLFDHVRQVMAILFGQGGAKDDEVKGIAAKGFLNTMPVEGSGDVMPGFGDFGGLGGKRVFVALAVENLDGRLMRGRGHGPSCGTHSELINWRASFRGHGRSGSAGAATEPPTGPLSAGLGRWRWRSVQAC